MKVLLINGSPRWKGNTNRALEEAAAALEAEGVETELVWIGNKEIRGCIACGICGKTGEKRCVFAEDCCNELIAKAAECDGFIVGSPVYYAGMAGLLRALMDRMFYAGGANFRFKPAAGVAVARRAGAIEAADQINKYFQINCQPLVSSSYWNLVYVRNADKLKKADAEELVNYLKAPSATLGDRRSAKEASRLFFEPWWPTFSTSTPLVGSLSVS